MYEDKITATLYYVDGPSSTAKVDYIDAFNLRITVPPTESPLVEICLRCNSCGKLIDILPVAHNNISISPYEYILVEDHLRLCKKGDKTP